MKNQVFGLRTWKDEVSPEIGKTPEERRGRGLRPGEIPILDVLRYQLDARMKNLSCQLYKNSGAQGKSPGWRYKYGNYQRIDGI